MCLVTMCQTCVQCISSMSLQQRTGVFELEQYLASRTLLCLGRPRRSHAQNRPNEKPCYFLGRFYSRCRWPRDDLRQVSRALTHALKPPCGLHQMGSKAVGPRTSHKLAIEPPIALGVKPLVRPPRGDTRATPKERSQARSEKESSKLPSAEPHLALAHQT